MLKKVMTILFVGLMGSFLVVSSAQADSKKGQKIIIKKLKDACGMNGAQIATKHTQDQWKSIMDSGKLNDEISNICKGKNEPLKEKYLPHVYDFLYEFASDSGNVPSC